MPRPNKPSWHARNGVWRCKIAGRAIDFRPGLVPGLDRPIGRDERPLIDGVPKRAWDALHAYKALIESTRVDPRAPTVYAVCQLYLQWAEQERDAKRQTPANYRGHVSHLAKFWEWAPPGASRPLADLKASDLGVEDLKAFAAAMAREFTPHYVANLCKSVQACFNWAASPVKGREPVRYLSENPVKGWRPPKPPKAPEKYLEHRVFAAFARWAWALARSHKGLTRRSDLNFCRMLWFLAYTGARPGEACALRWPDVDFAAGVAVLEEWKNRRSTGRLREVHLTPQVARLLRRIERLPGRCPTYVFTHRRGPRQAATTGTTEGAPWNATAIGAKLRKWRAMAAAAGVPVPTEGDGRLVPYLLRHTYISDGLMAGLSEAEVAHLTGTSASQVADTYGHIQRGHAARRAAELAARRGRGGG